MRFSISELAARLGGEQVGPDVIVDGVTIDTRTALAGKLYVPIVAERDGHMFIRAALEGGAPAYLTAQEPVGATAIVVADTAAALMQLGVVAREHVHGGVIGITGSVGKTTTKDLLRHCLVSTFGVSASERSFNNELGVPLTLLNAPDDAQWVVLEMGARGAGHVARLAQVGRPDAGIVTSVAMAHVEYFGDLDGVARAKSELVTALPPSGVAVLNFDDPRVARMASVSPCPVLGYAAEGSAEVRAEHVELDDDLRPRFRLSTPWGSSDVGLSLHGIQQVPNALAAAAAALWCGVPLARRGVRLGDRHRVAPAHGGASRSGRTRLGRGLLQRQSRLDRVGAAFDGHVAGSAAAGASRAHGRVGGRDRGRAPADRPARRGARD